MKGIQSTPLTPEKSINIMIRVFHWMVVALFVVLFVTGDQGDGSDNVHIIFGYLLISVIFSRILWGYIGDKNAIWKNYLYHPKLIFIYLSKLLSPSKAKFQIHNPAGSSMILVMMTLLLIITLSGLLLESVFEFSGALLFLSSFVSDNQSFLIKDLHDSTAHLMLFAIVLHLLGVLYSSYKYRVNMPLMMITGKINFIEKKEKKCE